MRERFPSRSLLFKARAKKPSSGLFIAVFVDQCLTHQSAAAVGTAVGVTEHGGTNGEHRETRGAGCQHFAVLKVEAGEGTLPKVPRPVGRVPVEQGTSTRPQRRPSKEGDEQEIADIATGQEDDKGLQGVSDEDKTRQQQNGNARPVRPWFAIAIPRIDEQLSLIHI